MKKIILIFISIPIITLTAQANSFYERIYTLKTQQVYDKQYRSMNSRGLSLDSKKFFYANRAAKNGNAKAQFDLAIMYATGRGVQKNEKIAFNWFHKSARNNNAIAKHYMGLSFLQGRGVRKEIQLARYWFRLAKNQGYTPSAHYLNRLEETSGRRYN